MELLPLRGRRRGIRQIGQGLGTLDREVFEAIAESPSPLLDAMMPRLTPGRRPLQAVVRHRGGARRDRESVGAARRGARAWSRWR